MIREGMNWMLEKIGSSRKMNWGTYRIDRLRRSPSPVERTADEDVVVEGLQWTSRELRGLAADLTRDLPYTGALELTERVLNALDYIAGSLYAHRYASVCDQSDERGYGDLVDRAKAVYRQPYDLPYDLP